MVHASDLRSLSITGRYAYALACVERLCRAWNVDGAFVLAEIDAHWQLTEMKLGCHWLDKHPFPQCPGELEALLVGRQLTGDQVQALHHAFVEARYVYGGSCYCAANDDQSMRSVLNVVGVLVRWDIELPPFARFRHASWSGDFGSEGYGDPFNRASFGG
jgi:hypothetical protein